MMSFVFSSTAASSLMSATMECTPSGSSADRFPRFSRYTSQPSFTSFFVMAILIWPVPPINSAFIVIPPRSGDFVFYFAKDFMPIIPQTRRFGYRFPAQKKHAAFTAACHGLACQKLAPAVGCFVTFAGDETGGSAVGSGVM